MKHQRGRKPTEVQDLNKLDDGSLITGKTAQVSCGISRTTRHRLEKSGKFPQSRKVGAMVFYVLGEVRAYQKAIAETGRVRT